MIVATSPTVAKPSIVTVMSTLVFFTKPLASHDICTGSTGEVSEPSRKCQREESTSSVVFHRGLFVIFEQFLKTCSSLPIQPCHYPFQPWPSWVACPCLPSISPGMLSRLWLTFTFNGYVTLSNFRWRWFPQVLGFLREEDVMFLDLKDSYLQISSHPNSPPYLRITLDCRIYQFKAFCLGLSTYSRVFSRVFSLVSEWAHR